MGTTAAVDCTGVATLIIPANERRASYFLFNNGANTIFVGENSAITTADGLPVAAFSQISEDRGANLWKGDIYGITAGTTEEMRYWERTQSG